MSQASSVLHTFAGRMEYAEQLRSQADQLEYQLWGINGDRPEDKEHVRSIKNRMYSLREQADDLARDADREAARAFEQIGALDQRLHVYSKIVESANTGVLESIWGAVSHVGTAVGNFLYGVGEAVVEDVVGLVESIVNWEETIENIKYAVTHFDETINAIWTSISDSWESEVINGDLASASRWFGQATGHVLLAFVGTKGIDKGVTLAKAAKTVERMGDAPTSVATPGVVSSGPRSFTTSDTAHTWGVEYYQQWTKTLTPEEYEALRGYTLMDYDNINAVLRGVESAYTGKNAEYVPLISQALQKNPTPEPIMVYRGTSTACLGEYQHLPLDQLKGKVISEKAFMSTSLLESSSFRSPVKMHIEVPEGSHAAYLESFTQVKGEYEMLFDKNQSMLIKDAYMEDGVLQLHVRIRKRDPA